MKVTVMIVQFKNIFSRIFHMLLKIKTNSYNTIDEYCSNILSEYYNAKN